MDLLTGLLLLAVVIGIAAMIVREVFDDQIAAGTTKYFRAAQNPVEQNLIGAAGQIIELPADAEPIFRVRIGGEIWSARLSMPTQASLKVGSEVRVIAVEGLIVDVEFTSNS